MRTWKPKKKLRALIAPRIVIRQKGNGYRKPELEFVPGGSRSFVIFRESGRFVGHAGGVRQLRRLAKAILAEIGEG